MFICLKIENWCSYVEVLYEVMWLAEVFDLISGEDLLRPNGKANGFSSTMRNLCLKLRKKIAEVLPLFWWIICAFLLNLSFWSRVTSLPFSTLVLGILILVSIACIYSHMGLTLASYPDPLTLVLVFPFQFAFLVCFP